MKLMKRVFENGQYVDVPVTENDDVVMKVTQRHFRHPAQPATH
jgi:hypothetical protein